MINILNSKIQKYTHIIHIADVHIMLNKRHEEYREVFNNLYEDIKKSPPETIVALLGDIFHNKSDLSPECIQMAYDLFTNVANLRPTILVAGNHDATLSNKSRLDSLTPIVDALNHPNLYYLKDTGLYSLGNVLFNNMGIFDEPDKYIKGKDIPAIYRNQYDHVIALFHGAVDKASLDTGYSISNPNIMPPLFDHHDIAMLGDIHKMQDMQEYNPDENKPCIRYCGSLVQRNHGESLLGHGYSMWDLKTRTYTHHEVPNDYGFFTIEVHKGKLVSDISSLPKKVRLRVRCLESISSEIKAVISNIKTTTQIVETAYIRMDEEPDKSNVIPLCKDIVFTDLTNVDYQNNLITEFLQKKLDLKDKSKIEQVLAINKNNNLVIKRDEFSRNLKWRPIRFEWDNMFSYGEGNVIDFTKMNGVYGIFGANKSGKSTILSSIIFCLFDKFDRGFKGMAVLNAQKTSFKCQMELEIEGVHYFIRRTGSTTRSGNVKVDVKFWKIVNGAEEELHGNARRDTNDIIRDYIGTYEDFILTAASFQTAKNNNSFIDMGNSERKDLLVQFIGLNIFDRLHESASERNKELNTILKLHKDKNYPHEIRQNTTSLTHAQTLFEEINKEVESLKKQIGDVNEEIISESSNIIKLDGDVPTNLPELENKKNTLENTIVIQQQSLSNLNERLTTLEKQIVVIDEQIKSIESSNLVESHKTYRLLTEKINNVRQKIDIKTIDVKNKLEKIQRLETHEYDPNCKFCMNNAFVKDAIRTRELLVNDKTETDEMLSTLNNLKTEAETYQWVDQAYETYTKLLTSRSKIKDECAILNKNITNFTNSLEKDSNSLKNIIQQIELYHRNKISVEHNSVVNSKISSYRLALSKLDIEHQKKNSSLMDVSGKINVFKNNINVLTKTMTEVSDLENESDAYQYYLKSVGRDGIPYQVICNTVPEIEKEVNAILSQIVDFTVQFETDGKNIVPYIVYEHGRWFLELTSGYERFISSIAIRIALSNISNLPKTTWLALDEGFGTLDAEHMAFMYTLFTFLKNNFDFIIIISHLDSLKDAVDKTIEISQEGNLSKVIFE